MRGNCSPASVDDARPAKTRQHRNNPRWFSFDFTDDAGVGAIGVLFHARNNCRGDVARNDGHQFSLVGNIERIKSQNLAGAFHFFARRNSLFPDLDADFGCRCDFIKCRGHTAAGRIAQAVNRFNVWSPLAMVM